MTGVQTCALPIWNAANIAKKHFGVLPTRRGGGAPGRNRSGSTWICGGARATPVVAALSARQLSAPAFSVKLSKFRRVFGKLGRLPRLVRNVGTGPINVLIPYLRYKFTTAQGAPPEGGGGKIPPLIRRLIDANEIAFVRYDPPPIVSHIDYIHASESDPRFGRSLAMFRERTREGITAHEVQGDHFNMIGANRVGSVGIIMDLIIQRALKAHLEQVDPRDDNKQERDLSPCSSTVA